MKSWPWKPTNYFMNHEWEHGDIFKKPRRGIPWLHSQDMPKLIVHSFHMFLLWVLIAFHAMICNDLQHVEVSWCIWQESASSVKRVPRGTCEIGLPMTPQNPLLTSFYMVLLTFLSLTFMHYAKSWHWHIAISSILVTRLQRFINALLFHATWRQF